MTTTTEQIATRFADLLKAELSAAEFEELKRRNAAYAAAASAAGARLTVCASHEFMDSNMNMTDAFESVMGREFDLDSDGDCALWSEAWRIAASRYLTGIDVYNYDTKRRLHANVPLAETLGDDSAAIEAAQHAIETEGFSVYGGGAAPLVVLILPDSYVGWPW